MSLCIKAQLCRNIIAEHARLSIGKVRRTRFIHLLSVGKEQNFRAADGFDMLNDFVTFLKLLISAHAQRLRTDFFEVPLFGQKQVNRIGVCFLCLFLLGNVIRIEEQGTSGLGILRNHLAQL